MEKATQGVHTVIRGHRRIRGCSDGADSMHQNQNTQLIKHFTRRNIEVKRKSYKLRKDGKLRVETNAA